MTEEDKSTEPTTLEEALGMMGGTVSLCWSPKPSGIFDSTQASKFVDEAVSWVKEHEAQIVTQPWLGMATTRQLLEELNSRIGHYRVSVPGNLSNMFEYMLTDGMEDSALNYRTVDQEG